METITWLLVVFIIVIFIAMIIIGGYLHSLLIAIDMNQRKLIRDNKDNRRDINKLKNKQIKWKQ